jgi:hypothetical protein
MTEDDQPQRRDSEREAAVAAAQQLLTWQE